MGLNGFTRFPSCIAHKKTSKHEISNIAGNSKGKELAIKEHLDNNDQGMMQNGTYVFFYWQTTQWEMESTYIVICRDQEK